MFRGVPLRDYTISLVGTTLVFLVLWPFYAKIDSVTAAGLLLLVVLFSAVRLGTGPAMLASVLGVAYLNRFYLPDSSFRYIATDEIVALAIFFFTSVMVGQLSSRLKRRAVEAQAQEQKITALYQELQDAFEKNTALEAERRAEQFKAALLDAVAHDLRTPLTSIKAAGSSMLQSGHLGENKELLEIVVEESDRLNHFIEDMIELARLERTATGAEVSTEPMDEIIAAAISRAKSFLADHRVQVECAPHLPPVACDSRAIAQIIFALLENASKYSPRGSTIGVAAASENGSVKLSVNDQGPGVPAELRERIFDKFVRYAVERHSIRPGLGLGLAIAKKIVEVHGGKIWVEEGANRTGASFVFTLPARQT